jgi:hypothetical protein
MSSRKKKSEEPPDDDGLLVKTAEELECLVCSDTAIWRAHAFDGYTNVRDELNRLAACALHTSAATPPAQPCAKAEAEGITANVERALGEALQAMTPRRRGSRSRLTWRLLSLKRFYSGSEIEQAWLAIHRARAELYLLYPDAELKAQTEGLGVLLADLPESSTLRGSLTTALGRLGSKAETPAKAEPGFSFRIGHLTIERQPKHESSVKAEPGMRSELQRIYEHAMGISDVLQREARVLRNNMMMASLSLFLVGLALGVVHAIDPKVVSLCTQKNVCPIDGKIHPFDVFVIELAGMLGGLLSVVIPLASGERIMTPYRVFNQQLLLKTLAGAASAIGGVLLVGGGLISVVKIDTTIALLAYAVVFGFAQQIVTGAVDRRANTLAKETPTVKGV